MLDGIEDVFVAVVGVVDETRVADVGVGVARLLDELDCRKACVDDDVDFDDE